MVSNYIIPRISPHVLRWTGYSLLPQRRFYSADKTAAPPAQTPGESSIHKKLQSKFAPSQLLVQDVSGGCGDFYAVTITSEAFKGLSTLKQHRMVQEELKDEIASIHGLQLKTNSA